MLRCVWVMKFIASVLSITDVYTVYNLDVSKTLHLYLQHYEDLLPFYNIDFNQSK